ncbi:hypothetical protein N8381_00725 [Oceanospirillaceae bacterium]|nr:hypothetical protein [Oceanospirillaceae bacterium]
MTWHSKPNVGIKYGFRSGLEARVAQELKAQGICYTYEEQQIKYTKPQRESTYTPDFVIGKLIIETKGRFMVADRQKHILIKNQHPELDIRFVFSNPKQKISKTSKTSYAMWCEKHGFLYAKESIPQQWLKEAQPS